jgi:quercetin dioxygenase-like cupin family protein
MSFVDSRTAATFPIAGQQMGVPMQMVDPNAQGGASQMCYLAVPVMAAPLTRTTIPEKTGVGRQPEVGFAVDSQELLRQDDNYLRVVDTTDQFQTIIMTLQPGDSTSSEVHTTATQAIMVVYGAGEIVMDGQAWRLVPGAVVVIRPGVLHKIQNTESSGSLKLVSFYNEPLYEPGEVYVVKPTVSELDVSRSIRSGDRQPRFPSSTSSRSRLVADAESLAQLDEMEREAEQQLEDVKYARDFASRRVKRDVSQPIYESGVPRSTFDRTSSRSRFDGASNRRASRRVASPRRMRYPAV